MVSLALLAGRRERTGACPRLAVTTFRVNHPYLNIPKAPNIIPSIDFLSHKDARHTVLRDADVKIVVR